MRIKVVVDDRMQQGYVYHRTEPVGRNFHPDFTPQLTPTPIVALHRAVALAEVEGAAPALRAINALPAEDLADHAIFHAVRADLLERLHDSGAAAAWDAAAGATANAAERAFYARRKAMSASASPGQRD